MAKRGLGAKAPGLPNDRHVKLAAGHAVTVPVKITNNGAAPEAFFLDPRLNITQVLRLAPLDANSGSLPLTTSEPYWFVPTQTSSLYMQATGSKPIMFDYQPDAGDPDIASASAGPAALCSKTPSSTYTPTGGTVTSGIWFAIPTQCGPYGAAGAPSAHFAPIVIFPGQSATVNVTITPSGPSGTDLQGVIYVDDVSDNVPPYGQLASSEI